MNSSAPVSSSLSKSPATFFLVLLALYVPLWVLGFWTDKVVLLPGITLINLIVFTPALAALLLAYHEHKAAGIIALLKRFFDYKQGQVKNLVSAHAFLVSLHRTRAVRRSTLFRDTGFRPASLVQFDFHVCCLFHRCFG